MDQHFKINCQSLYISFIIIHLGENILIWKLDFKIFFWTFIEVKQTNLYIYDISITMFDIHRVLISVLPMEIQLSRGEGWDANSLFNPATCLSLPGSGFPASYVVVLLFSIVESGVKHHRPPNHQWLKLMELLIMAI